MIYLLATMFVVFISYVSFIWIKYGVQQSISASYYVLPKNQQILFILFCWGFAFPAVVISMGLPGSLFMFFACSGIVFVGAACAFRDDDLTKRVHMVCATLAVLLSQTVIALYYGLWYLTVGTLIATILGAWLDNKHKIWWAEIAAFLAVGIAFVLMLI